MKRFPGVDEPTPVRPVYGRDALFLAQRLRRDYWHNHKERAELLLYKNRIAQNQRRADSMNELRRVEGFIQSNLAPGPRMAHLERSKAALLKSLGMSAFSDKIT